MTAPRSALAASVVLALIATAPHIAFAGPHRQCLSPQERRAAVAAHNVVPLAKIVRTLKARARGELLRARLCQQNHHLVYVLTVFSVSGKVTRAIVDASNGTVIGGR